MLTGMFLMMSPVLNLGVGQAFVVVARMDCEAGEEFDFNGAKSTSQIRAGSKSLEMLFTRKWPQEKNADVSIVVLSTQAGETDLYEVGYEGGHVPVWAREPQPPITFTRGESTVYSLTPQSQGEGEHWNYQERQVLLHGALVAYKGVCKLRKQSRRT